MGAISEGDRVLRWITIITWIPAFALLVAYGAVTSGRNLSAPLLLIPMSLSALWAGIQLSNRTGSSGAQTAVEVFIVSGNGNMPAIYHSFAARASTYATQNLPMLSDAIILEVLDAAVNLCSMYA